MSLVKKDNVIKLPNWKMPEILIVDDDHDYALIISDMLHDEIDIQEPIIDIAYSYEQAMYMAKHEEYDVCIIDYYLGGKNGLDLLYEMRESGIISPIVFLSNSNEDTLITDSIRAGALDFINKRNLIGSTLINSINSAIDMFHDFDFNLACTEGIIQEVSHD